MATREQLMQALRNADAAGDTAAATAIARRIRETPAEAAPAVPEQPKAPERTYGENLKRNLGMGARTVVTAAASPFAIGGNFLNKSINAAFGTKLPMPSDIIEQRLDQDFPIPENTGERVSLGAARMVPAAVLPAALGPQIAGNALIGATLAPEGQEAEAAAEGGAGALGGAVLGRGVVAALRGGRNLVGGARNAAAGQLRRIFGDRTDEAIAALRGARPAVQGEQITAGKVATARLPELKALEEGARSRPGANRFLEADAATQQARQNVLDEMAFPGQRFPGDEMSPAAAMRQQVTRPLYERADPDRVQLAPELDQLFQGPEVQNALRGGQRAFGQSQTNAAVAGRPVPTGEIPTTPAPLPMRDPSTGAMMEPGNYPFMPEQGTRSIADLQNFKNYLSREIRNLSGASDEAGRVRLAQLTEARRQLTEQMAGQSGNYAAANEMFRTYSAPQNQAEVAAELARALRGTAGKQSPTQFIGATENAARTIKRADQSPRFEFLQDVMTPEQMAQINAVRGSAQRDVNYANLDASQKGIIPEYLSVFDQLERMTPNWLNTTATFARGALKRLGGRSDAQVARVIDEAMTDPNALANLMEMLPPADRSRIIGFINAGGRSSAPAFVGAATAEPGGNE